MTNEIITLQIGHYSNFVGTHWWNIQEASFTLDKKENRGDVDFNILHKQREDQSGEVDYVPRLISLDLKGSLKTLPRFYSQYKSLCDVKLDAKDSWDGKLDVYQTDPEHKNAFLESIEYEEQSSTSRRIQGFASPQRITRQHLNLDDKVEVWSDYLRPNHLHSRSLLLLEEFSHNDPQNPFDLFGQGSQLFASDKVSESFEDQLRYFSDDCDHLQGFNILLSGYDGFAGLADGILRYLEDEFPKKIRFCVPLYQPSYPSLQANRASSLLAESLPSQWQMEEVHRLFSSLLCFDSLIERSHLFTPAGLSHSSLFTGDEAIALSLPNVRYKQELPYHTSAVLALALDTITFPTQCHSGSHMAEWYCSLVTQGRKLCLLSAKFPSSEALSPLEDCRGDGSNLTALCPRVDLASQPSYCQSLVGRGMTTHTPKKHFKDKFFCSDQTSLDESLRRLIQDLAPGAQSSTVKVYKPPCHVGLPFPDILPAHRFPNQEEKAPVISGLHNSDGALHLIQHLLHNFQRHNLRRFYRCFENGFEMDDIPELLQSLTSFSQNYVS